MHPTCDITSKFYILPKIHKKNMPVRPIVNSCGSVTYKCAKHLAKIIIPFVIGKSDRHVKTSDEFAELMKTQRVDDEKELCLYDVTTLCLYDVTALCPYDVTALCLYEVTTLCLYDVTALYLYVTALCLYDVTTLCLYDVTARCLYDVTVRCLYDVTTLCLYDVTVLFLYDVTTLFASIPMDKAVGCIRRKLRRRRHPMRENKHEPSRDLQPPGLLPELHVLRVQQAVLQADTQSCHGVVEDLKRGAWPLRQH